jgi:hypothetical protein
LAVAALAVPAFGWTENFDSYASGSLDTVSAGNWSIGGTRTSDWVVDSSSGDATVGPGEGHQYWSTAGGFDSGTAYLSMDLTYGGGCGYDSKYFARMNDGLNDPVPFGIGIASHGSDIVGEYVELSLTADDATNQASGFKLYSGSSTRVVLGYDRSAAKAYLWTSVSAGTKVPTTTADLTQNESNDKNIKGPMMWAYGPQGTFTVDNLSLVVPEPATMIVLALGGLGVALRRRR